MDFVSLCEDTLKRFGFDHYGLTPIAQPLSMDMYRLWLEKGHEAGMTYLKLHEPLKADPKKFAPRAETAIVVAKAYYPHPYGASPLAARTALYAQGDDYHVNFKKELESVAKELANTFVNEEFLCFTDSAPILERDLAYRAGLGWFGKNTCLIHPKKGSLFFIGQILTSVLIPQKTRSVLPDMCGTCDRCIRACPTGAIEEPRVLNANKCISYWTIESREAAPIGLREKFNDWFFGCDICQTVCPWNEKSFGRIAMQELSQNQIPSKNTSLIEDLRWILTASRNEISRKLAQSPLLRARPSGLKKNALIVVGNLRLVELLPEVEMSVAQEDLKEVASFTIRQLRS